MTGTTLIWFQYNRQVKRFFFETHIVMNNERRVCRVRTVDDTAHRRQHMADRNFRTLTHSKKKKKLKKTRIVDGGRLLLSLLLFFVFHFFSFCPSVVVGKKKRRAGTSPQRLRHRRNRKKNQQTQNPKMRRS